MKLMGVVPASEIKVGDCLVGAFPTPAVESTIVQVQVMSVFNTGHGRVQVDTLQAGSGWLSAEDLICVLRDVSL